MNTINIARGTVETDPVLKAQFLAFWRRAAELGNADELRRIESELATAGHREIADGLMNAIQEAMAIDAPARALASVLFLVAVRMEELQAGGEK